MLCVYLLHCVVAFDSESAAFNRNRGHFRRVRLRVHNLALDNSRAQVNGLVPRQGERDVQEHVDVVADRPFIMVEQINGGRC